MIREDPTRRGLLYAGTEIGLYVSFDDGGSWQPLKGNLPVVPIHDLVIKEPEGDMAIATHGRAFWVLDDLGPIRAMYDDAASVLVKPRPVDSLHGNSGFGHKPVRGKNYRMPGAVMVTYTQKEDPRTGDQVNVYLDAARNPPDGAIVDYFLAEVPEGDISLAFFEADSREIRSFSSRDVEAAAQTDEEKAAARKNKQPRIPKEAGLNRWVWNLRYPDATKIDGDDVANELVEGGIAGPQGAAGTYRVRLTVGERTYEQEFEVRRDPRLEASDADLGAQFELLVQVHARLSETHVAVNQLRTVRRQAEAWLARSKDRSDMDAVRIAAQELVERLAPIEAELIQARAVSRGDTLGLPVKLNGKLASLQSVVASGDGAPTLAAREVFADLSRRVQTQLDLLGEVLATEVAFLNQSIANAGVPPVGA